MGSRTSTYGRSTPSEATARSHTDGGEPQITARQSSEGSLTIRRRSRVRRVDLLGRSLDVPLGADPVTVLREYLSVARTASARALAEKAVVLIYPLQLAGTVAWPV